MRAKTLLAYRVMSYVTGVLLVILVFVGLPLKYGFDSPDVVAVVGTAHGFLFMVYVVVVLALGFIARWSIGKIVRRRPRGDDPARRVLRRAPRGAHRAAPTSPRCRRVRVPAAPPARPRSPEPYRSLRRRRRGAARC